MTDFKNRDERMREIIGWVIHNGILATSAEHREKIQDQALQALKDVQKVDEEELINLMTEHWQVRDMVHGSIMDEKRRDRMIKLLAHSICEKINGR